eukprot:CAMPEP_0175165914 /NCGR_PEP_ID=MMETSP0087-20121206/27379_1 /TAXON_ID=136419 /ORGANISM="Unknown Unknown, Strain D1" /LENGTH=871 /DNA_ID=CAMNT_0016455401 /DNA_START=6 /DNA_END=2621 /DNA_ORIENTATION=+
MSSTLDEAQDYAKMDVDDDYEGGQWIDGEFYFTKKKEKRAQTREEQLYGVFAEDYGGDGGGGGSYGGNSRAGMMMGGVAFQASSKILGGTINKDPSKEEPEVLVKMVPKKAAPKPTSGKGSKKVSVDKNFGTFEKHTKGFGMKMLQKMGFTGRLGKNATGIARPIEPKLRPKGAGLAHGGFKEKNETENFRNADEELAAKEESSDEEKETPQRENREGNWRKGGKKKAKQQYKTAAEVAAEQQEKEKAYSNIVIDMRGPTKISTLDKISSKKQDSWTPTGSSHNLPELQHNLRLLVDLTEEDIHKINRSLKATSDKLVHLKHSRDVAKAAYEREQTAMAATQTCLKLIDTCSEDLEDMAKRKKSAWAKLEMVAGVFETIREAHPSEWQEFRLAGLSELWCFPLVKAVLHSWEPLQPLEGEGAAQTALVAKLQQLFQRWRHILAPLPPHAHAPHAARVARSVDYYKLMMEKTVMSKVNLAFMAGWDCKTALPAVAKLLQLLQDILPAELVACVQAQLVVPKLKAEVDSWNPRASLVHPWLKPWCDSSLSPSPSSSSSSSSSPDHPLLPRQLLHPIFAVVCQKLGLVLQAWHPSDGSALQVITPWLGVFPQPDMEALLARAILPRLHAVLRTEFQVHPHQQRFEPFQWVMAWVGAIPGRVLVQLLRLDFFPKWFAALAAWLQSAPNFEEVSKWYLGWKNLLPAPLRDLPVVKATLNRGLDMMNTALSDVAGVGAVLQAVLEELKQPVTDTSSSSAPSAPSASSAAPVSRIQSALEAERQQEEKERRAAAAAQVEISDMSMKDTLEKIAVFNSLTFLPNAKRGYQDGHQVFSFGKVSVYMDKRVIFAYEQSEAGGWVWTPISLPALLERARDLE